MSQAPYQTAFVDHPVHESLEQSRRTLDSLSDELLTEASEHDPQGWLSRLDPVFGYVATLLAAVDAALVNTAQLDALQANFQQIFVSLTALRDNKEFAQIPTIQGNGEALIANAAPVAPGLGVWAQADLEQAAEKLGEAATAKTRSLNGQVGSLQARLNQVVEKTNEILGTLKTSADEQTAQLQSQIGTLTSEIETDKTEMKAALTNFQTAFEAAQTERVKEAEETRTRLTSLNDEAIDALREADEKGAAERKARADDVVEDLRNSGNQIIEFLDEKKDQAAELVDLVATSSTAGAFGNEARDQREAADRWRRGAIEIAIAAGAVGFISVILSFFHDASSAEQIAKAFAVALLLSIAAYAANQSSQHRRREQRAKRLELELVAFGPFTEPLDPTERNAVRKELIERLFVGDPGEDQRPSEAQKIPDEQFNIALQVLRLVEESRK